MYKRFEFKDLLSFEVMLFPKIATFCYRLLVVISILVGFVSFIQGIGAVWGGEILFFSGLAMMIIIPFVIRLWFEFLLVLFMINDKLSYIRVERSNSTDEAKNAPRTYNCKGCGATLAPNISFCGSCGLATD